MKELASPNPGIAPKIAPKTPKKSISPKGSEAASIKHGFASKLFLATRPEQS